MIDTRERAYAERVPRTDALLATDLPEKLRQKRTAIDAKLTAIETGGDVAALGTDEQRAQWARIRRWRRPSSRPPATMHRSMRPRAKLRLIKGVLFWQLDESFKARVYTERHALRELDAALSEAQNRWVRVERARRNAPNNTGEFAARIAALAARIDALKAGLTLASQRQKSCCSSSHRASWKRKRRGWPPTKCKPALPWPTFTIAAQARRILPAAPADGARA